MTSHEIIKTDLLDILFEGRNKLYGAYTLRRYYNNRLGLSLGIALSLCFLFFLLKPDGQNRRAAEREKEVLKLTPVVLPPPPTPPQSMPPVKQTVPPPAATASLTDQLHFVDEPDPNKAMEDIASMQNMLIGNVNEQGPVATGVVQPAQPQSVAAGGSGNAEAETVFKPEEKAPEFPGGMQAWVAFLNKYLQTPDELAPGEKRTVLVSFVVDVDGSVTGFKVVQSGGRHFDEEVVRVLRKMPRWKPAVQNGHLATMPFTQPVTFVGIE